MSKKSKNIRDIIISDFYCVKCANKGIPIVRVHGQEREPGHLKKLFCLFCQEETNMVEVKPSGKYTLNTFLIEYNFHNFDENGNRKEPYKNFLNKIKKESANK